MNQARIREPTAWSALGKFGQIGALSGLNGSGLFSEINQAPLEGAKTSFIPGLILNRLILASISGKANESTVQSGLQELLEEGDTVRSGIQVMVSGRHVSAVVEGIGVGELGGVRFRRPGWNESSLQGLVTRETATDEESQCSADDQNIGAYDEMRRPIHVVLIKKVTESGIVYAVSDGCWAGMMGRSEVLDQILGEPPGEEVAEAVLGTELGDLIDQATWEIRGFDGIPLFSVNPLFIRSKPMSGQKSTPDTESEELDQPNFELPDNISGAGGGILGIKAMCYGNVVGAFSNTGKDIGPAGPVLLKISNSGLWGPSTSFSLADTRIVKKQQLDNLIQYDGLIVVGADQQGKFKMTFSSNPDYLDSQGFWASGSELLHLEDIDNYGRLYLGNVSPGEAFSPATAPNASLPLSTGQAGYRYVKDNSDFTLNKNIQAAGDFTNFGDVALYGQCPPSVEYSKNPGQPLSWVAYNPSFTDDNLLVDVGAWYDVEAVQYTTQKGCLGSPVDMHKLFKAYYYFSLNDNSYDLNGQYDLHANMYLEGFSDFFIQTVGCTVYQVAAMPDEGKLLVGFAGAGGEETGHTSAYETSIHPVLYQWDELFTIDTEEQEEVSDNIEDKDDDGGEESHTDPPDTEYIPDDEPGDVEGSGDVMPMF